jgi:DNA polymerase-3 subunit epsilon
LIVDGEVIETHEKLIKPHRSCSYFDPFNIGIHGITAMAVRDAPIGHGGSAQ